MKIILSLLALTRSRIWAYALAVSALALATLLFLLVPKKLGELINIIGSGADALGTSRLAVPAIEIAAIMIGNALLVAACTYITAIVSEKIGNELRENFFRNLLHLPIDRSSGRQLGASASQFASDLNIIQSGLSDTLINLLRHGFFTIGAIVAMFLVDVGMSIISMISILAVATVIWIFVHLATKAMLKVQAKRAETLALLVESAMNSYVIQAYGRISYFSGRFSQRLNHTYIEIAKNTRLMALINPVSLTVFAFTILAVLAYGVGLITKGRLSVADLIAFVTYALILVVSISQLGMSAGRLRQASVMYDKHAAMLRSAPAATSERTDSGTYAVTAPSGYDFEAVTYTYPNANTMALNRASFSIMPGVMNAVIGQSGAGKSTLAALLSGLVSPNAGVVRRHGGEVHDDARIAIVPQNPFLFAETIRENIRFGRDEISDDAIERAARMAQIHDHIFGLEGKYDHFLQEAGANFSRGQQQRIALARALAGKPSMLLMDEATASLDSVSERAIHNALRELRGTTTVVVIAHHGELLSEVDHLIVLDAGQVIYSGPPQDAAGIGGVVEFLPQLFKPKRNAKLADAT